jgi:gamma-glutamylcyclotransferase (GGCT)/AIG2-like uncharacterized protein YtfP
MTYEVNDDLLRLAVYGTLAPGRSNHEQLAHLPGRWFDGVVRGRLHDAGWGADLGFPGLVLDDDGDDIAVQLFEAESLRTEWPRLDAFEGPGYRRVAVHVRTSSGAVQAHIYVLATNPSARTH